VDSSAPQLLPPSWRAAQPGAWSRYQIATTVRHENESSSSSIYAAAHPGAGTCLPESLVISQAAMVAARLCCMTEPLQSAHAQA
jgi:hypothetical protein